MQDQKTLTQLVCQDPQYMIRHLARVQMYAQALEKVVKEWAQANGDYISQDKSVRYQRRNRSIFKLDAAKAKEILEGQGVDIAQLVEPELTEKGILAKLGQEAGNKVIAQLMQAGAYKTALTTYWRLQVK